MRIFALHWLLVFVLVANGLVVRAEDRADPVSGKEVESRYIPLALKFRQEVVRQVEMMLFDPALQISQPPLDRVERLVIWKNLLLRSECHMYAFMSLQV